MLVAENATMYAVAMAKKLSKLSNISSNTEFTDRLASYRQRIDADIAAFSRDTEAQTAEQFGANSRLAAEVFNEVLNRGGKRIRGALTMVAYEMFGGANDQVALRAARAAEILQTYLLITDDICDRSETRRGGPSAHILLKNWHEKKHLKDDAGHFGESIAMNAALLGSHMAIDVISELDVSDKIKVQALKTLNKNLIITAHGQFNDIFNEVLESNDITSIENVLIWKTAYYTFVSPLQFGAELAGVSNGKLQVLADYGVHAGRAFQIGDDIVGMFSKESDSGKNPLDDIREGKRTLLASYVIDKAETADSYFFQQCLGNHQLTNAEFKQCQEIVVRSGALTHAQAELEKSAQKAIEVLDLQAGDWDEKGVTFLRQLVHYLVERKA